MYIQTIEIKEAQTIYNLNVQACADIVLAELNNKVQELAYVSAVDAADILEEVRLLISALR